MKKLLLIFLILLSLSAKSQIIKKEMVIDSVIYKKHQNHMILLHRVGPNYFAGLHYTWRGLGHPQVAPGDTAVLVRNDPKHFYHPYIKILYHD